MKTQLEEAIETAMLHYQATGDKVAYDRMIDEALACYRERNPMWKEDQGLLCGRKQEVGCEHLET